MFTALLLATATAAAPLPNEAVRSLDLQRYLGTWYEIARLPTSFERGCVGTTATYSLRPDGDVRVLNRCHKETLDGPVKDAEGKAWLPDGKAEPGKLKVQFFWPFYGAYWVVELGSEYEYAVVGHPDRDYGWILSRTPQMDPAVYAGIVERLKARGYPVEKLEQIAQKPASAEPLKR